MYKILVSLILLGNSYNKLIHIFCTTMTVYLAQKGSFASFYFSKLSLLSLQPTLISVYL